MKQSSTTIMMKRKNSMGLVISFVRCFLSITPTTCRTFVAGAASSSTLSSVSSSNNAMNPNNGMILKRIHAQVIHRHGDRTPITPLLDELYWSKQLISESTIPKMSAGTVLVTEDSNVNKKPHPASGRGPFGKLTTLGLLQMVELGTRLRNELVDSNSNGDDVSSKSMMDAKGRIFFPYLWASSRKEHENVRVISTNFQRTIQSVQGLLIGLFPNDDNIDNNNNGAGNNNSDDHPATTSDDNNAKMNCNENNEKLIPIDVRCTDIMIPDPTPRRSQEQVVLEEQLVHRPYIIERDNDLLSLAYRVTTALHPLLASDAHEASFGTPQRRNNNDNEEITSIEIEPLSWNQLAEVTKCLLVRNKLPDGISPKDCHMISNHAAWKWFELWKNPRLCYLSMHPLVAKQLQYMQDTVQYYNNEKKTNNNIQTEHDSSPCCLTIWSAHDSTLIGLLCAYRLERPTEWPEYASYLLIEVLEVTNDSSVDGENNQNSDHDNYYVRFSLNGLILRSKWEDDDDEPVEMIQLSALLQKVHTNIGTETRLPPTA